MLRVEAKGRTWELKFGVASTQKVKAAQAAAADLHERSVAALRNSESVAFSDADRAAFGAEGVALSRRWEDQQRRINNMIQAIVKRELDVVRNHRQRMRYIKSTGYGTILQAVTFCRLRLMDPEGVADPTRQVQYFGYARCSVKDRFDPRRGRRDSLTDALRQSGMGKEERQVIWLAFMMWSKDDKATGLVSAEIVRYGRAREAGAPTRGARLP